ncbi:MAG: response regulator transcription factor [Proteobacteria bacterium]|nr:MAG: response regulator transcription factor [Pseudomonadota bacterium]
MLQILLVEDDLKLAANLQKLLVMEGARVDPVGNVAELNEILVSAKSTYSLIILDRLLGRTDTKDLVPEIRKTWASVPILVLSTINTPMERSDLLNLGVDDYLGKPFLNQELIARVRALSRRAKRADESFRQVGNSILNFNRFTIQIENRGEVTLPQKEFLLLKQLTREVGRVWSREDLLASVWGNQISAESNVLEATITHLRRSLEACKSSLKLKNLRNVGYFIELMPSAASVRSDN